MAHKRDHNWKQQSRLKPYHWLHCRKPAFKSQLISIVIALKMCNNLTGSAGVSGSTHCSDSWGVTPESFPDFTGISSTCGQPKALGWEHTRECSALQQKSQLLPAPELTGHSQGGCFSWEKSFQDIKQQMEELPHPIQHQLLLQNLLHLPKTRTSLWGWRKHFPSLSCP